MVWGSTPQLPGFNCMTKKGICWICGGQTGPLYVKGYGTENEFQVCGSCSGTLAAIESRLFAISRCGKLDSYFTASGENVPSCEKDEPEEPYDKDRE